MLLFQFRIYRRDLRDNPRNTYVFGDNELRVGYGGQAAEMRGEPNAHGIATLRAPGQFWSEDDAARQIEVLLRDFSPVLEELKRGRLVVFPSEGIGTGLSQLHTRAPSTFRRLQEIMQDLAEFREPRP